MEKVIGGKKFVFKEKLTMLDWQKVKNFTKMFMNDSDDIELCFNIFPVMCTSVDWQTLSDQEKLDFIKNIDDMEVFTEISECLAEIQTNIAEEFQKKKTNMNMNSESETKPE